MTLSPGDAVVLSGRGVRVDVGLEVAVSEGVGEAEIVGDADGVGEAVIDGLGVGVGSAAPPPPLPPPPDGAARDRAIEYVDVVVPSWAVTTIVIAFEPTARLMGLDADPELTDAPLTVTVAFASVTVGVTETLVTLLATDDV